MNVVYMGPGLPELISTIENFLPDEFSLWVADEDSPEYWERMAEADFLAGYPSVTPELLRVIRRVRLIQVIGAGYDNIDVDAAARAGIPVATAGGTNAVCVAEHIFALILALHRQIIYAHNAVRAGEWPYLPLYRGGVFELSGKVIGLVGFGHIGQAVARIAHGFGMQVLYHRRNRLTAEIERSLDVSYASLEDLLPQADIVSVQVPLTPHTRQLVGRTELGLMKPSAYFINTSRGGTVDEDALIECLAEKKIAGAGLDVFAREPISSDNPLLQMENVVLTPHIGGAAQESIRRTVQASVANIVRVAAGQKPHHVV